MPLECGVDVCCGEMDVSCARILTRDPVYFLPRLLFTRELRVQFMLAKKKTRELPETGVRCEQ